jgi:hypothetical protein
MSEYMRNIVLSALYEDKDSFLDNFKKELSNRIRLKFEDIKNKSQVLNFSDVVNKDLSEEDISHKIIPYLKECIDSNSSVHIDLLDKSTVSLNPDQAKDLIYIHDNLNLDNQNKFRTSLVESKDSYDHFVEFSKVKHRGG